ncbi:helix-turn-helix domain-containing protein [Tropicibacter sp. Alg240-R139]|uniref:helix-turn-helix domain-containing protein n=1 Tax=Tropicibacter sp. Alg240-R139 TaxID=2305991 RepID=UPI0013DFCDBC|nr:helix-turn-helix transcriptional regulator [Tropicibacter sp. Alg240-R139]
MNSIDSLVGSKIRARRKSLGISQVELGRAIGVRFQQVQKYESGANRVSASRLWLIAETLDLHINHFFEETPLLPSPLSKPFHRPDNFGKTRDEQDTLELIEFFTDLSAEQKHAVLTIIKNMSARSHPSTVDIEG